MNVATRPINILSICAGVGGLELGLHLALGGRARTVGYVEREAYAASTLVARMEDSCLDQAPVWDDLCTFDGTAWRGCVDIVSAGFPCQPFSSAGKRLMERDPRYLWPQVCRVIAEAEPGLVFIENVAAAIPHPAHEWRCDLERMGFKVADDLFSAEEVGADFEGIRWFALGAASRIRWQGWLPTSPSPHGEPQRPSSAPVRAWPSESEPAGVADGVAHWMDRLRACGNGVVPLQAAYAFCTLAAAIPDTP